MGDGGVGKTTLVERLTTGKFNPTTMMTIGIDFSLITHEFILETGETILMDITIWDLGGEDRFRFMLPSYLIGADGGLLLYDVNRFTSAMSLPSWVKMWRENSKPRTPLYLIGTKIDLVTESLFSMVENNLYNLKAELGIKDHFLLSSKNNFLVGQLINIIANDMLTIKLQRIELTEHQTVQDTP